MEENIMKWYHYIACFFAGLFLANTVPHFVHGISGESFPTPFAHPPGKGLSSPTINVVWALGNLVVGYVLLRAGRVSHANKWSLLIFFAGFVYLSVMLSIAFMDRVHWYSLHSKFPILCCMPRFRKCPNEKNSIGYFSSFEFNIFFDSSGNSACAG